jgi:hypothetical protein
MRSGATTMILIDKRVASLDGDEAAPWASLVIGPFES